ncbi:MAG TPA: MarR family winged helix-turn-helix transcriptional regulator [Hyphomonadaceae bacterium]|jgi:DNA-binding MarR family transcriptional regulator|nr:MarR family winged helix-turn-helix transcriptional regulator [Hyphomonadaceae bacterium]
MPDQHGSRNIGAAGREQLREQGAAPLSTDACVLRHVARVSRAVVSAFDPALSPLGLTGHQFNLMMTLGQMGPMTVGNLADVLGMDASGVPRAIRPLADVDLVTVERGADRRQRVLSLTSTGRALLDRATPAWLKVQTELVEAVGANRWSSLMSELRILRRAAAECSTRKSAPAVAAAE